MRSYSYNFQKNEKLVRRWDNAPHWPQMKTYAYHFHLNGGGDVQECPEVFIKDVLPGNEAIIKSEGRRAEMIADSPLAARTSEHFITLTVARLRFDADDTD